MQMILRNAYDDLLIQSEADVRLLQEDLDQRTSTMQKTLIGVTAIACVVLLLYGVYCMYILATINHSNKVFASMLCRVSEEDAISVKQYLEIF
mmetsp:Transcript_30999/g.28197  ORF Transcript_30999/g.28197 Transcript_30999/m.28197 type:complete len:93 (+) Transcript_30999:200-478(+)